MSIDLAELTKEHFYTKWGLFFGCLTVLIITIPILISAKCELLLGSIISIVLLLTWFTIWLVYQNLFPKTKKDQKGIYFIICSDKNEKENKNKLDNRLNNDILNRMDTIISRYPISSKIKIHILNDYQKDKLTTILKDYSKKLRELNEHNINQILKYKEIKKFFKLNSKINGSYFIWGNLRFRNSNEEPTYILQTIDGLVCHKPTPLDIKKRLSESLLELAYEKITNDKYSDAKSINEENLILMPNNNYIINQRVAIEFYLKNTNEALKFNEILKTSDNNYWLYNRGFLLMSNGNFQAAYNIYSKLSGSKYSGEKEFVQSCIINDELILKKNPKYKYIHFILGFLYYKKLKNIPAALEHFEAFINADKYKKSNDNYMKYFIKDSKKYIKEINEYI